MKSHLSLLLLWSAALLPTTALAEDLLIREIIIVSAEREHPSPLTDVLIRDGRIAEIGKELAAQDSVEALEGGSRYLAPGLIDGHTHLAEIPGMITEYEEAYPEIASEARAQLPRSYLFHGFTTVVDLNSRPTTIEAWNRQDIAPTAHFCGAAPIVDGYPMRFTPRPLRYRIMPYFLFDETRADDFPEGFDPEQHTPAAVVSKIRDDGGICVKTHFEPGFGGRGDWPIPTETIIRKLVAAANAQGMPVLLHANSQIAQSFGVAAGVDAFAHGMWTWNDRTATTLNRQVTDILDAVIEQDIAWQPTIQVLYGERDLHDPDYLSRASLKEVVPQNLIDWYATDDGQWWRRRMLDIPYVSSILENGSWQDVDAEPIARVMAALRYLATHDARLLFGSDTPADPTFANPPGLNGRLEMRNWIEAGATPEQLFRAATIVNAEFFALDDEIGTVEVGKRADLLLMRANPMTDPSAFDTIDAVILRGRVLVRSSLSANRRE